REKDDLTRFLASLSTAWHQREVRATHCQKPKRARHWRTTTPPRATCISPGLGAEGKKRCPVPTIRTAISAPPTPKKYTSKHGRRIDGYGVPLHSGAGIHARQRSTCRRRRICSFSLRCAQFDVAPFVAARFCRRYPTEFDKSRKAGAHRKAP